MTMTRINLTEALFTEKEQVFVENEFFKVILFKYSSGVCAARIENPLLSLIVLPFHGQQVWRFFHKTDNLTMRSIFDEPMNTDRFGLNYGAHLIHCGLTASGNPSAEDTHPLHGELPNCRYKEAYLLVDMKPEQESMALGGTYTYRNSLEYHYTFEPRLTLSKDAALVDMEINAVNHRQKPMKYMYMAHINWLPVENSRLLSSTAEETTEVFSETFGLPNAEQEKYQNFVDQLKLQPALADRIDSSSQFLDPELCLYMHMLPDQEGFAHAMQVFPEGGADYVSFRVTELPNAVRWYARTGDEDAVAFAIPTTNNHLGFSRNLARGLLKEIPANSTLNMRYRFGYLDAETTKQMEEKINKIKASRSI